MHNIKDRIYAHYEADQKDKSPREYLGASSLGEACERRLWYQFRWAYREHHPGRILRLFRRGYAEENVLVKELEAIGFKVTGRQNKYTMLGGHVQGHIDGIVDDDFILEIKTFNAKRFKALVTQGLKESNPKHYAQCQIYMAASGIPRCLYIAVNKDDDDIHTLVLDYDATDEASLALKAERIVYSAYPPPKISEREEWYQCRMCPAFQVCHKGEEMQKNCRTCRHSEPLLDGSWWCRMHEKNLTLEEQRRGCDAWSSITSLSS